jgi:ubiquinone/menaquinone biosynthesis C-methylase UbiE
VTAATVNPNREIYARTRGAAGGQPRPATAYDRRMRALRLSLVDRYGAGRDVLDLCCGTGSYLIPMLGRFRRAAALDFSPAMLESLVRGLGGRVPAHLAVVQGDATALPLAARSLDFVYSYASLYSVPDVHLVFGEVARVLRDGGYAALELGNRHSLNTIVCREYRDAHEWVTLFLLPYRQLRTGLRAAGFEVVDWRVFQVLPMWWVPPRMRWLYPVFTDRWKRLFGIPIAGRMLDEWVSGVWPLRLVAFRHLAVVRKRR